MKHIGFDDSTVLREYARIASEKGLVKEAGLQERYNAMLAELQAELGKANANIDRELGSQPGGETDDLSGDPNRVALMNKTKVKYYKPVVQNMIRKYPRLKKYVQNLSHQLTGGIVGKQASSEDDITKSAVEQKADPNIFVFINSVATRLAPRSKTGFLPWGGDSGGSEASKAFYSFLTKDLPKFDIKSIDEASQKMMARLASYQKVAPDFYKDAVQVIDEEYTKLTAPKQKPQRSILEVAIETAKNPVVKKALSGLKGDVTKEQIVEFITSPKPAGLGIQVPAELVPVLSMTKTQSLEDNSMSKEAEGKLYDISGETGEQVVEKAHPGGGTKTELTHSKTDENLVETIVEQQKKDIDVVNKVPKGTYATLIGLYRDLCKMGHKDMLDDLVSAIDKIAASDLKKKVASPGVQEEYNQLNKKMSDAMIDTALGMVKYYYGAGNYNHPKVMEIRGPIEQLRGKDFLTTRTELQKIVSQDPKLSKGTMSRAWNAVSEDINRFTELKQQLTPTTKNEETVDMYSKHKDRLDKAVDPKAKKRMHWAKLYNRAISGTDEEPLTLRDAQNGNKKYWAAIKKVRRSGVKTLAEYTRTLNTATVGEGSKPTNQPAQPKQVLPPMPPQARRNTQMLPEAEKAMNISRSQLDGITNAFLEKYPNASEENVRKIQKRFYDLARKSDPMTAVEQLSRIYDL